MRKTIVFVLMIVLVFTLSGCEKKGVNDGMFVSNSPKMFSGFTAIELAKSEYELADPISITFYYGHDIDFEPGHPDYESMVSFDIEIVLVERLEDGRYGESNQLYFISLNADEFLTDDYKCYSDWKNNSPIEFNKSISFDVDFSLYDYSEGEIVISIIQTRVCDDCEGDTGFGIETESSQVIFTISEGNVNFD
jgi:hypothetical protein